jgi:hypothetical protein
MCRCVDKLREGPSFALSRHEANSIGPCPFWLYLWSGAVLCVDSRRAASVLFEYGRCTIRCNPITPGWARSVPRGRERKPERLSEPRDVSGAEPLDSWAAIWAFRSQRVAPEGPFCGSETYARG